MSPTTMRVSILSVAALLAGSMILMASNSTPDDAAPREVDLGRTVSIRLPETTADLKPVAFKTADGKTGWVVKLPGNEAIATPTYIKGKLLVSGGFSSHQVYAFDAKTGRKVWTHQTLDNGPTAVVADDDSDDGAYSTESCDLEVINTNSGNLVWHQLLAGSLLTQPAISDGKLYVAFPGGGKGEPVPPPPPDPNAAPAVSSMPGREANGALIQPSGYRLLCADLRTGRKIWEQDISADVITAPVVDHGNVYLTCMDGTAFCMTEGRGCVLWHKKIAATSAPTPGDGAVLTMQKMLTGGMVEEGMVRLDATGGEPQDPAPRGVKRSPRFEIEPQDNAPANPNDRAARRLDQATRANLNLVEARDAWTYQGPRAAFAHGAFINAQQNLVNSLDAHTGKLRWQALVTGPALDSPTENFLAPVLGKQDIYLTSANGYVVTLNQKTAQVKSSYRIVNAPLCLQPCLAGGNLYAGTTDGRLICIPLDADADGWYGWGGNSGHTNAR